MKQTYLPLKIIIIVLFLCFIALSQTEICRSVGPLNTSALSSGTSNPLSITGDTALLALDLPGNTGIGDALVYNSTNDIVFIHERVSAKKLFVKNAAGGSPNPIAGDVSWQIFRAYTSLRSAEKGEENTGIPVDVRNFDAWTDGRDLISNNEIWRIACYGDNPDIEIVTINGWSTGLVNYLDIFVPRDSNHVGISQRHSGVWDGAKYHMWTNGTGTGLTAMGVDYLRLEGLQINLVNNATSGSVVAIYIQTANTVSSDIRTSHCILKKDTNSTGTYSRGLRISEGTNRVWNNIIYDFTGATGGEGIKLQGGQNYIYNNAVVGCKLGMDYTDQAALSYNNIFFGNETNFQGLPDGNSRKNAINRSPLPFQFFIYLTSDNITDYFRSNSDFRLDSLAPLITELYDQGEDLSSDQYIPFADDIEGGTRSGAWDIGPDELTEGSVGIVFESNRAYHSRNVRRLLGPVYSINGRSFIRFIVPEARQHAGSDLMIYDAVGRLLQRIGVPSTPGVFNIALDNAAKANDRSANGCYFVRFGNKNGKVASGLSTRYMIIRQ